MLAQLTGLTVPRWRVPYPLALGFAHLEELACSTVLKRNPMATSTGVRLTQRAFHFDGHDSAERLGILPMRPCLDSIVESLEWFETTGLIRRGILDAARVAD